MKKSITLFICIILIALATRAQPAVDGVLNDAEYITMASKLNANAGFGADINVTDILYYPDDVAGVLYLGVKSKMNIFSDDGIGIFLNISGLGSPTGAAAGNTLGFSGAGHFIDGDGTFEQAFKADMEVDYAFAFNPGYTFTDVYWDAASYVGGYAAEYQGNCQQDGVAALNGNGGTLFTTNSITFAYKNFGGADDGLEMAIPYSELGASAAMQISASTFVVSSTAYFSDVTVPGNVTTGNLAFNPDFALAGDGPFSSDDFPLSIFTCDAPTGLSASAITASSATLSWDAVDGALGYNIQFENTALHINKRRKVGAGVTSITLGPTQISAGNDYVFAVKSICDGENSGWSDPYYFSTPLRLANTAENIFSVYPNPSNGNFFITLPDDIAGTVTVTVRNMAGDITLIDVIAGTESGARIPVQLDVRGLYLIIVDNGADVFTQLVSIQ